MILKSNFSRRFAWLAIYVTVAATALSCASGLGFNLFSDSDDVQLGKELDQEIRKNPQEYPILKNAPEVKAYVVKIAGKVLSSPDVKKRGVFPYQVEVVHDDSTINAFATPGGYIYVYTGLIRMLDNEASLAGVLGHEIAHAELRHATKRISSYYGINVLLSIVLGQNPSQFAEIAANLFTGLGFLANSRSDESQSDEYSIRYLDDTEYYPGAIRFFFEKILEEKKSGSGTVERLLSTHPMPEDRVAHVEELLKQLGSPEPSEGNLFAQRYERFKEMLP
ncbi:MAG: M48 family metallopeptidase [Bacteroidota bacterium]